RENSISCLRIPTSIPSGHPRRKVSRDQSILGSVSHLARRNPGPRSQELSLVASKSPASVAPILTIEGQYRAVHGPYLRSLSSARQRRGRQSRLGLDRNPRGL